MRNRGQKTKDFLLNCMVSILRFPLELNSAFLKDLLFCCPNPQNLDIPEDLLPEEPYIGGK